MSDIPCDVIREILRHLPAESLLRFRTVCKAWYRIIDDPSFIKSHTNNQQSYSTILIREPKGGRLYSLSLDSLNCTDGRKTIDVTPVKQLIHRGVPRLSKLPVPSCNGLILISHRDIKKNWVIWNPLTRGFHELPTPNTDLHLLSNGIDYQYDGLMSCGFGYDYAADDYKVVRIDKLCRHGIISCRALVYSLKLGSWRMIKDCPCVISFIDVGVFLNDALHWRSTDGIIALNLGTEDYSLLPGPPILTRPQLFLEHLDALGGCLVLSCYNVKMNSYDGWVMEDYGVEKSWMKLYSIEKFVGSPRPVVYLKSKRQVLLKYSHGFLWFDVGSNSVKKVTIHGLSYMSSCQFCPGSIFRFDDSGSTVSGIVAAKRTAGIKRKRKRKRADTSLKVSVGTTVVKRKRANTRLTFCVRNTSIRCRSDYNCWSE